MSDLIERLRGTKWLNDPFPAVFWDLTQEAANEIEAKDRRIAELEAIGSKIIAEAKDAWNKGRMTIDLLNAVLVLEKALAAAKENDV